MTPAAPRNATGAAMPPDERLRQHGVKLMMALSATLRVGRAYKVQNQVFVSQIAHLVESLAPILQQSAEAVLVAHDADLYLNGVRIPVAKASFKFQQTVVEMFTRLAISGLRFDSNVSTRQLTKLFDLILKPEGPVGRALVDATRAQAIEGAMPILFASVDPESPAAAETSGGDAPAAPTAAARGAGTEPLEASGRRRHSQAVQGARLLLMPTSLQSSLEVRHAKRVVQPLVEGVSLSEPVVVGLSALTQHDEFTYAHAVNVCGVSVAIGHFLGLDRRALSDLGVAALLHDVGKDAVGSQITHDFEHMTAAERAIAERHTLEGAKLLARATSLNPTTLNCMRVALEHHVTGPDEYPAMPDGWRPSLLSRIVAVADCFINLQSRLGTEPPVSPTEALGMILGPYAEGFESAILWALVRTVGFYPAGQIVELDDGTFGRVLAPNAQDPARPHIRVMATAEGERIPEEEQPEYRPLPSDRAVRHALKYADYPDWGRAEPTEGSAAA